MMCEAFRPLGLASRETPQLCPASLAAEVEAAHARIYDQLLNGVYKAGIGALKGNAAGAAAAAEGCYAMLDELEAKLATRRFLLGGAQPTIVDIRLTMTLLRYDASYRVGFRLTGRGGILVGDAQGGAPSYPVLGAYVRDIYALVKPTVDWPAFRQYYRWAPGARDAEELPDLERIVEAAGAPHGRKGLAGGSTWGLPTGWSSVELSSQGD